MVGSWDARIKGSVSLIPRDNNLDGVPGFLELVLQCVIIKVCNSRLK